MAAKMPTGERPKKNSGLSQFIAGSKSNKLTPAEARVAAGRYRDMVEKIPEKYRNLDNTGVVLGKAIRATQKKAKTNSSLSRTSGGISGSAGRSVAPMYKEQIGNVIKSIKKNWSKPLYTDEELRNQRKYRKMR